MNKDILYQIIVVLLLIVLAFSFIQSCNDQTVVEDNEAYKASIDSMAALLFDLRVESALKQSALTEAKKEVQQLEKDTDSIHRWYNRVIEELAEKTAQEIIQEFEKVYPNKDEERVVAIAVGQAYDAVETNIQKEYAEKRLDNAQAQISKLQSIVGLQTDVIANKDAEIILLEQRFTITEREYKRIIAHYQDKYEKQSKLHRVERVVSIGAIAVLTVLTLFK